jgi:hypothetical protein
MAAAAQDGPKARADTTARKVASRLFWGVARCLALIWLAPALIYNVDWTGHGSWQANGAAVVMILGSALFIEGSHRFRSIVLTPLLVVAALFLVYVNTKQAMRTISSDREAASEAKSEKIQAGSHLASQRVALGRRIEVQVQVAGWEAVSVLQTALTKVQNSDPALWDASSHCEATVGPKTRAFCEKVAAAKTKVDAAKERDKLQAQLDALPMPVIAPITAGAEQPVADAYTANMVSLLNEAGYKPNERLVKAEEALSRALGFELLAALGPTCHLQFILALQGGVSAAGAAAARLRNLTGRKKRKVEPEAPKQTTAPTSSADDIDRFIADELEAGVADARMLSKDIRAVWQPWCQSKGVDPKREDELWKRLRTLPGVKHDPNNNRPRYLGVRLRAKPGLRLAADNTMDNARVLGPMGRRIG